MQINSKLSSEGEVVDIFGIGFGPSNISLAIAAQEMAPHLSCRFFESKTSFSWHRNMLFPNATMQVSFLKDLVTFRNPCSPFSFLNYVHSHGRFPEFSNLSRFSPSREEYSDYLRWCARAFDDRVSYGQRVTAIEPIAGVEPRLAVTATDSEGRIHHVVTRSVVYAGGLRPVFPIGIAPSHRILHCSRVLERFAEIPHDAAFDVTVLGGGQSAAEVVEYLHDTFPRCRITAIVSTFGYMPADDTPFVNQIFDPGWVGPFYDAQESVKQEILSRHATTNYAAVDIDLIQTLYQKAYRDRLSGENRLRFLRMTRLTQARETGDSVQIELLNKMAGKTEEARTDLLICATGYEPHQIEDLLSPDLAQRIERDGAGRVRFTRAYRLCIEGGPVAPIYGVGMNQYSHGLSSTLLSNMAVRSGEIVKDLQLEIRPPELYALNRIGLTHAF